MRRLLALSILLLFNVTAWAQAWPAKPVRIIAPFAPGGSADTLGRLVAQKLNSTFGAAGDLARRILK